MKELESKLKPIATGGPIPTLTQVSVRPDRRAGLLHPMGSINSTAGIFAASQVATTL
jgi:hypothetical protein